MDWPEHDVAPCGENGAHLASRRHTRADCPTEQEDAERAAEADFMRRYPGVL